MERIHMHTAWHSRHPCSRESPAHIHAEGIKTEYSVRARGSQTMSGSQTAAAAGHLLASLLLIESYSTVVAVLTALLNEKHSYLPFALLQRNAVWPKKGIRQAKLAS